ncbi:hypothetical protein [Streptomyces sp. NPDC058657]|uniref:hypothetical protein n=1 Tax=unclassified Streptomyces TaxID=2593676 RepID=UPI00366612BE
MTTSSHSASPVPALADAAADAVCALADAVATGWPADAGGTDDALDALDVLLGALGHLDADAARLLAPAVLAAARLRHHLDSYTADQGATPNPSPVPVIPFPRTAPGRPGSRPQRRGLGPGYQGIQR